MLRIKDPKVSVPFYETHFGFKLIHKYDFPQWNFALYFLGTFPDDEVLPEPGNLLCISFSKVCCAILEHICKFLGTPESEDVLWKLKGTCLELTHNYGSEADPDFKVIV